MAVIAASVSSAVCVSLACTLISLLMQNSVFKNAIKYVCGLCVLMSVISILSPVLKSIADLSVSFPDNGEDTEITDGVYNENVAVQSVRYICKYVKTAVAQRFDIESELITVSVTADTEGEDGIIIKSVTVALSSERTDVFSAVAEYVSSLVGSGCTVIARE